MTTNSIPASKEQRQQIAILIGTLSCYLSHQLVDVIASNQIRIGLDVINILSNYVHEDGSNFVNGAAPVCVDKVIKMLDDIKNVDAFEGDCGSYAVQFADIFNLSLAKVEDTLQISVRP